MDDDSAAPSGSGRVRKRVRKHARAEASAGSAADAERREPRDVQRLAASLVPSWRTSWAEASSKFDSLTDEERLAVIRQWREERESRFLKPSTKFDLCFYATVLAIFYVFMYFYHGVDMIAVVRELSSWSGKY